MAAIENLIKQKPGIGVQVKAYTRTDQRIAEWYEYTIIAHDKNGNPVRKITFEIDAQRTHNSLESLTRDQDIVKEFLRETSALRNDNGKKQSQPIPEFSLPEVVSISDNNKKTMKIQSGPMYAQSKKGDKDLTKYANVKDKTELHFYSAKDTKKYEAYLQLVTQYEKNKVTYEQMLAVIKSDTPESLAMQFEKDLPQENSKRPHLMRYNSFSEQFAFSDDEQDEILSWRKAKA